MIVQDKPSHLQMTESKGIPGNDRKSPLGGTAWQQRICKMIDAFSLHALVKPSGQNVTR
jgi:hypothetical protein